MIRSKKVIPPYELDFYYPDLKLAIEVQGPHHFMNIQEEKKLKDTIARDIIKKKMCLDQGITLLEINIENGVHYERINKQVELEKIVLGVVARYLLQSK